MASNPIKNIAIIGGGITGLAAAHHINTSTPGIPIELFEASKRLGGVLFTEPVDGFLVEHSADMFTTVEPAGMDLCRSIGIDKHLIGTNSEFQRAFIASGDGLEPVPKGLNLMSPTDLDAIRSTPLLSEAGRKRFLEEETIPSRYAEASSPRELIDESLESFAIRRFGQEAFEKIIQPLVGGIYTADPAKLGMKSTLPQYLEMEKDHGSIIKAIQARMNERQLKTGNRDAIEGQSSGARYHLFVAPKQGMSSLIQAIESQLTNVQFSLGQTITQVERSSAGWILRNQQGMEKFFSHLIVTCPSPVAAKLLSDADPQLAGLLRQITFASSAVVVQGYRRTAIDHPLNGFGLVVPRSEGRSILAASFSSIKFNGRAPEDSVLIRSFLGGGCQSELLEYDDQRLVELSYADLKDLLKVSGSPLFQKVIRWNESMPQYHVGHVELVDEIESRESKIQGLAIAGKCYRGVGIPACIRSGQRAANKILADY